MAECGSETDQTYTKGVFFKQKKDANGIIVGYESDNGEPIVATEDSPITITSNNVLPEVATSNVLDNKPEVIEMLKIDNSFFSGGSGSAEGLYWCASSSVYSNSYVVNFYVQYMSKFGFNRGFGNYLFGTNTTNGSTSESKFDYPVLPVVTLQSGIIGEKNSSNEW